MTASINKEALEEYQEAARWYEEQRHLLGVEFTELSRPPSRSSRETRSAFSEWEARFACFA
jgi:hypothetical protein